MQDPWSFEVNNETNTMIEYAVDPGGKASCWEILSSFLTNNRLIPIFIETNAFGILDKDTGLWSGAVAMVNSLVFLGGRATSIRSAVRPVGLLG